MKKVVGVFVIVGLNIISGCSDPSEFEVESELMQDQLGCKYSRMSPANDSQGALFTCIGGDAETVKYFINEEYGTGKIESIKFLWNKWTKDRGYGRWADSSVAKSWANIVANRYAPEISDKLTDKFLTKSNTIIRGNEFTFRYTFDVGPAIDEHMFVVTRNNDEEFQTVEFQACVYVTREVANYSAELKGDSRPNHNDGFVSYNLSGRDNDDFICEIYENWNFRIKAAYGESLPFVSIGGGQYNITY